MEHIIDVQQVHSIYFLSGLTLAQQPQKLFCPSKPSGSWLACSVSKKKGTSKEVIGQAEFHH